MHYMHVSEPYSSCIIPALLISYTMVQILYAHVIHTVYAVHISYIKPLLLVSLTPLVQ